MGDVGDYWNDARNYRRARRAHWHECPTCAVRYGTGTLVAPGQKCRNCDWIAPGQRGDDVHAAERDLDWESVQEQQRAEKKARALSERTCRYCNKVFKQPHGRKHHEQSVHARRLHGGGSA